MTRLKTLLLAFGAIVWTGAVLPGLVVSTDPSAAIAAPEDAPAPPAAPAAPNIDVHVDRRTEHVISFSNPVVLAVAGAAAVLIIGVIIMAARGGGTTIIREEK